MKTPTTRFKISSKLLRNWLLTGLMLESAACLCANSAVASPPLYHLTDLGTLGGSSSFASDINNSGQVVGYSFLSGSTNQHAFRTAPNAIINPLTDDLGTLGGDNTTADGIND